MLMSKIMFCCTKRYCVKKKLRHNTIFLDTRFEALSCLCIAQQIVRDLKITINSNKVKVNKCISCNRLILILLYYHL